MVNKVELAKMIGLYTTGYPQLIDKSDIRHLLDDQRMIISETFCGGIEVEVYQDDFGKDKLDIKLSDLEKDAPAKFCVKQVQDLLWERAADKYLSMVHNSAMIIGGNQDGQHYYSEY